jgi:hypothetical protein
VDVFDGAVAQDREGSGGANAAGGSGRGVDAGLVPVLRDTADHGSDVCRVSAGKVAAALSLELRTAIGGGSRRLRIPGRIFSAAAILGGGIRRRRSLADCRRLVLDRLGLFLVGILTTSFGGSGGGGCGCGVIEAVGGVEHFIVVDHRRCRHGQSSRGVGG